MENKSARNTLVLLGGGPHMWEFYDELLVKQSFENFLASGILPQAGVRNEIKDSWARCQKYGLDPHIQKVHVPSGIPASQTKPDEISKFLSGMLDDIITNLEQTLKENHAALMCTYSETGIVYTQLGNEETLKYLNDRNIGIGTCLREEYIGTIGAVLNPEKAQDAFVVGEEHYLDLLKQFVTWSYFSTDYGNTYVNVFMPKEKSSQLFVRLMQIFMKAREYGIKKYKRELSMMFTNEVCKQLPEFKDEAHMFVDSFGKILLVNENFCDWFNTSLTAMGNAEMKAAFPELEKALTCLTTGKSMSFVEVEFPKLPPSMRFMRMDVNPMRQMETIVGLVIRLSNSAMVRKTVNKIVKAQSYYTFDDIIGESPAFKEVKQRAQRAAQSESSIVIIGESGTGKELFAQAIHHASRRKNGPFVPLNCAAIPAELITSELFGYVEGAFTGSRKGGSMGKFEYAHGGTIFLDEIGEMPMHAQTILLRVLEEKKVTRIGSNTSVPIDVRLVCATNRNLYKMIKDGTFRSDLFYRINVISINPLPLRDRITDIPILVNYFLDYFNAVWGNKIKAVSSEAAAFLMTNNWPGNIRELRNTIECAYNNSKGPVLQLDDLPLDYFKQYAEMEDVKPGQTMAIEDEFALSERKKILELLIEYNGNKTLVAQNLGVCRSTLYRKLKAYNLQ